MPPARSNRARSTTNRDRLFLRINRWGSIMAVRCLRCRRMNLACTMLDGVARCSNCVRANRPICNRVPFLESDFEKLDREQAKLDADFLATQERILAAQAEQTNSWAKLARLEKLRYDLATKKGALINNSLQSLEDFEREELLGQHPATAAGVSLETSVGPPGQSLDCLALGALDCAEPAFSEAAFAALLASLPGGELDLLLPGSFGGSPLPLANSQ